MFVKSGRLFALGLPIILASCVFDDDFTVKDSEESQTANFTYHTVEEVKVKGNIGGDFDGFMIHAGNQDLENRSGASHILQRAVSTNRDMVGFVSERPALNSGSSAQEVANSLTQLLSSQEARNDDVLSRLSNFSSVSEQTYAGLGAVTRRISLTFFSDGVTSGPSPTQLTLSLANLMGVNKDNGEVSNWPKADSNEPNAAQYSLYLSVVYVNQDQIVVMASVAPSDVAGGYSHLLRSSTTPTNITLTGIDLDEESQQFTASGGGGLADFLFVVDNSGSMSSSQEAVRNAGSVFAETMQSSGLNFLIGTITTDSTIAFEDTFQDGPFTSDLDEYQSDVTPGTGGSSTERGIYNAEQALLSTAQGDETDGIVTLAGHPRTGAGLSVIIISDERSQYPGQFNPDQNLFIDRGYRVYAIVDPQDSASSQYDDLANSSGGNVADIRNVNNFPEIFQEIATLAGAASSRYSLDYTPIESSIEVKTNGDNQPRSSTNGWQYVIGSNSVLFTGSAIPSENDNVEISYNHLPVQTWWVEPAASAVDAKFRDLEVD